MAAFCFGSAMITHVNKYFYKVLFEKVPSKTYFSEYSFFSSQSHYIGTHLYTIRIKSWIYSTQANPPQYKW